MQPEERSFNPGPKRMGELSPIDVEKGTVKEALRQLARGIHQTHNCLEAHISKQDIVNDLADVKRDTLVAKVDAHGEELRKLTLALGVRKPEVGEAAPKAKAAMGWRDHGKIALTILGSLGGFVLFLQIIAPGLAATWDAIMKASP